MKVAAREEYDDHMADYLSHVGCYNASLKKLGRWQKLHAPRDLSQTKPAHARYTHPRKQTSQVQRLRPVAASEAERQPKP